jgi:hypothetical protein
VYGFYKGKHRKEKQNITNSVEEENDKHGSCSSA